MGGNKKLKVGQRCIVYVHFAGIREDLFMTARIRERVASDTYRVTPERGNYKDEDGDSAYNEYWVTPIGEQVTSDQIDMMKQFFNGPDYGA